MNEKENYYASLRRGYELKKKSQWWKLCVICKKPIFRGRGFSKDFATCSKDCQKKWISKNNKGRRISEEKSVRVKMECQYCAKIFLIYPAWLKKKNGGMYCSISCRQKVNIRKYLIPHNRDFGQHWSEERKMEWSKKITGDGNPSWKGGVTYFRKKGNYIGVKYVRCPKAYLSMARKDGYIMEHRLLVAQHLK
ncbi:hypothetical protein KAU33_15940 [Candidatus Dependentiae bacterium]|nr:hypothetical protein [Candidatus Dependentiae bacterium]